MTCLRAEALDVSFGMAPHRVRPLAGVSIEFSSGEVTLVRGPSGSGKSTLLAVLGGLLTPDHGRVFVGPTCLTTLAESDRARFRMTHIGFVFQAFQLFETMTALENAALPLMMAGVAARPARQRASELLDMLGLAARASALPRQMSGGEQQRVAIARALSCDPAVVLADEPTAALDGSAGRTVATLLQSAARHLGKLVVVISHDERLLGFSDRVIALSDGRVASDGRTAS